MSLAQELLQIAREQALGAGELLLEKYRAGVEHGVRAKSTPTDLVSDADLEAERCIREGIARARPGDGMVGEEGDDKPSETGLRWVVDPLDGTVNYLFGIPQWCVSVAVQDDAGSTLAGAICDPLRGDLFTAARGEASTGSGGTRGEASTGFGGTREGASTESGGTRGETSIGSGGTREGTSTGSGGTRGETSGAAPALNGEPLVASRCADLATAMVATGFNYDARVRAGQAEVLQGLLPRVRDIRRFGSAALDLAWTAAGRYDAYYERGPHVWDVAAGVLMCELAGLQARELPASGEEAPWGVLVAPPALVNELMELVGAPSGGV